MLELADPLIIFGFISALFCRFRHRAEWRLKESRYFPVQGQHFAGFHCPKCNHEIIERRWLSNEEADELLSFSENLLHHRL